MNRKKNESSSAEGLRYFKIKGMSCRNCEEKIKKTIENHIEAESVTADFVKGIVVIKERDKQLSGEDIGALISNAGYEAKEISRWQSLLRATLPTAAMGLILTALLFAAGRSGILSRIPEIKESLSYPMLFAVGLMTSFHCIGMCGGINLSQTCGRNEDGARGIVFKRGLLYNLGRTTSYTVLGGLVGGIGSVLSLSLSLQGAIIITAGIIMMIMGFNMIGLFSLLGKLIPSLPASLGEKISRAARGRRPFTVGVLNGFMPCGPLQSMQIYALSTGSILKGALSMFLFSAGTIPLMLAFGTVSTLFSRKSQRSILKLSAFLIILLGGSMIGRGMNLQGISPVVMPESPVEAVSSTEGETRTVNAAVARIEGDYQVVVSDVGPYSYESIIVQAGIPVKWYLEADAGELNGCNGSIIIPEYDIKKGLIEGKTLIEFTPEETGSISFSCWMGMINSGIGVVEDIDDFDSESALSSGSSVDTQQMELQFPAYTIDDVGFSVIEGEEQSAELYIEEDKTFPSILVMERKRTTTWSFIPEQQSSSNSEFIFPAYNARLDFSNGETVSIELTPQSDFYYYSSTGKILGFVLVVDDLSSMTAETALETVLSYSGQ